MTDKGSGEVSVSGVSLTISVDLLVNRTGSSDEGGHFALNVTTCSFSVDKVTLLFRGGARYIGVFLICKDFSFSLTSLHSYVYNLFGSALSDYLRQVINTGVSITYRG